MRIRKCKPCGENSPYWNWMEEHGMSDFDNNALMLDHTNEPPSAELTAILDAINEGAEKTMTQAEKRAFQLVIREGMTHERAAKKLCISRVAVTRNVNRAVEKVRILAMIRLPMLHSENVTTDKITLK